MRESLNNKHFIPNCLLFRATIPNSHERYRLCLVGLVTEYTITGYRTIRPETIRQKIRYFFKY